MANIKITWTQPSDTSDTSGYKIFKKSVTNAGDTSPSCDDYTGANALPTDSLPSGVSLCYESTYAPTAGYSDEYIDQGVGAGNWHYAVFTYNDAGYSPCVSTTSATTVS